jgi:hypothetical protein
MGSFRPSQMIGAGNNYAPARKRDIVMRWLFLGVYILMCFPTYFWFVLKNIPSNSTFDIQTLRIIEWRNHYIDFGATFLLAFFFSIIATAILGVILDVVYLVTKRPKNWL